MGRRTKDGRKTIRRAKPRMVSFRRCDYVRGGTLDRYMKVSETEYWIYRVSARMAEMQCDRCARMHTDKNVECSATQGVPSPYTDTTMLYNFKTGAPVMRVPGGEVLHGGLHDAISILRIYV